MPCNYCGAEISENAERCGECGKPTKWVAPITETIVEAAPRHSSPVFIVVAIIIVVIGIVIAVNFSSKEQETTTATTGKIDCSKPTTSQEISVCYTELTELANQLTKAYTKISPACKKNIQKEQEWTKKKNACASNIQCLKNSYKLRIRELENCR